MQGVTKWLCVLNKPNAYLETEKQQHKQKSPAAFNLVFTFQGTRVCISQKIHLPTTASPQIILHNTNWGSSRRVTCSRNLQVK